MLITKCTRLIAAGGGSAALALLVATPAFAQSVTTGQGSYNPGNTVTIIGSGWAPGGSVSLLISENPPLNSDVTLTVTADDSGNFVDQDFTLPDNAGGTNYTVAASDANGASSQTMFTDDVAGALCANVPGHGAGVCAGASGAPSVTQLASNPTHYAQLAGSMATYEIVIDSSETPAYVDGTGDLCPDQVEVQIKSSDVGNTTVCGTLNGTNVVFSWTAQSPSGGAACNTTIVAYRVQTCFTNPSGKTTCNLQFSNTSNDIVADDTDDGQQAASAGIGIVDAAGNVIVTCAQQSTSVSTTIIDKATGLALVQPLTVDTTAHDQVTVCGTNNPPTGTVTLSFFAGNTQCDGSATAQTTLSLSGGTVSGNCVTVNGPSESITVGQDYSFRASYNGNANFTASTADCEPLFAPHGEECNPVASISTQILDQNGKDITNSTQTIYYVTVQDQATVTGSCGTPTGSVTFHLFATGDCSGSSTDEIDVLDGSGLADSTPFVPTESYPGKNYALSYLADYSGGGAYPAVTGTVCESLALQKIQPSLATAFLFSPSGAPATPPFTMGASIQDEGLVSAPQGNVAALPTPTGNVSFTFYTGGDCSTGTAQAAGSAAVGTWSSVGGGPNSGTAIGSTVEGPLPVAFLDAFRASYAGDDVYKAVDSACEPFGVQSSISSFQYSIPGICVGGSYTSSCSSWSASSYGNPSGPWSCSTCDSSTFPACGSSIPSPLTCPSSEGTVKVSTKTINQTDDYLVTVTVTNNTGGSIYEKVQGGLAAGQGLLR